MSSLHTYLELLRIFLSLLYNFIVKIIKLYEEKKKTRFQRFIERHKGEKNKRDETVEEYLRNLLRNRLRRLALFGYIDKAYIQEEIQQDMRITNGTVNRYCTVITNNQSQKSMSWTFKGDKINLSFEALIANLQSLDNGSKVFSSKYVHTSHICNFPRRIGVCLEKTHITLESAKVNLSNRKKCCNRRRKGILTGCKCSEKHKCLGAVVDL